MEYLSEECSTNENSEDGKYYDLFVEGITEWEFYLLLFALQYYLNYILVSKNYFNTHFIFM